MVTSIFRSSKNRRERENGRDEERRVRAECVGISDSRCIDYFCGWRRSSFVAASRSKTGIKSRVKLEEINEVCIICTRGRMLVFYFFSLNFVFCKREIEKREKKGGSTSYVNIYIYIIKWKNNYINYEEDCCICVSTVWHKLICIGWKIYVRLLCCHAEIGRRM